MQISIDIREYDTNTIYGRFVAQTLSHLIDSDDTNTYILYTNKSIATSVNKNTKLISTKLKKNSFFGQMQFKKILEKDHSHLYFFFDEFVPLGFTKNFMFVLPNLQEVFFPTLQGFKKFFYKKYLKNSTTKAQKILCFDTNTAHELNEKIDVREEKIDNISGFFHSETPKIDTTEIKLDIKSKHNIPGDYLIYDAGNASHHNFERVLKVFQRVKAQNIALSLIIICDETTKDIALRQKVLDFGIEKIVFFLGSITSNEEVYYYGQSAGAIFPGFYNSFPFHFWKAISYQTPIIASDLKSTREVMEDQVYYFNSRSTGEALEKVQKLLSLKKGSTNYKKLQEKLNPTNTAKQIQNCITSWESSTGK